MSKFLIPASLFAVLAVSLTPEMTNALAILIAALFVGLVNLYMARTARLVAIREIVKAVAPVALQVEALAPKVEALAPKVEALAPKVEALIPIVTKIDAHVNSEKTRVEGEMVAKDIQIRLQRETIDELKKAAALLAQAKTTADIVASMAHPAGMAQSPTPAAATAEAPVLEKIEKNTVETAAGVAKLKKELI